jgi:hypothetical protein
MNYVVSKKYKPNKEAGMLNQEPRKLRSDLTEAEKARLEKFGSLTFRSIRRPDMRVEKFIPSRTQH